METLGKLFGSVARVKIMRLFLLNPGKGYETKDIAERSRVSSGTGRRELAALANISFIKKKTFTKNIKQKNGRMKSKRVSGWMLNEEFAYIEEVKHLLIDSEFMKKEELISRFRPAGKIKLFIISGIFMQGIDNRVDFLLIGDNFKKNMLATIIKNLEAEIGKELSYAVFNSEEFLYRLNMYDKLVRDILDFDHEKIVDNGQFTSALAEDNRLAIARSRHY